ncbi:ureidoglycolate lyase [Curvibacter sp. HBC61]|uniref:Ureidoglycolate lyase n=1 Tax=Curvibacter cyanobacteriorum TaxID=3026422 RepID=A0ABT5N2E0_9BURK|nr:ureidoglycolate lyase [Curvibacter sp. HBC61]MDD0840223.1 ureidoglycolate lyase [Curvibacter sp. HBC61]
MNAALALTPATLPLRPLSAEHFAPFGTVLEGFGDTPPPGARPINQGSCWRLDLALPLSLHHADGQAGLAIYQAQARSLPITVHELERHKLGSQSFMPLEGQRFIVVVARANALPGPDDVQAFVTNGQQGVVLHPGTWHHALLALQDGAFVVLERHTPPGAPVDCELSGLAAPLQIAALPPH